jgi:acyl transferase domain-containing protein/NADPH:quinone reductase-like Zn-dependent oxidoreductase/SAM-dependent methyltransferase/acyl carrier protein
VSVEPQQSPLSPIKQAYLKLQEMQARLHAVEEGKREPIAIVGMACRFPGNSHDPESFWHFLREGGDAIREIPKDRWDIDAFYDPQSGMPGKMYTRCGAFLDGIDQFDPQFFGIAPREAIRIDPQQRLLLEVSWEALERSGIAPDSLSGSRTGVFVGVCTSDYSDLQIRALDVRTLDTYHAAGIAHSMASGRLSYVLGLQGPSLTLDTACSSSLVSVHLACQSLRRRECGLALAGGVNVMLTPDMFIALSKASMLARDGRCKTFDASADGYARGEGCGVVVLKRLSDALSVGDQILAVIRGSAVNQDGPSSGLTAPNGPAQTSVIRDALTDGGVAADQLSYIETHGTGTSLGDPIEVQAIAAAYCDSRTHDNPLLLGALKSNIGHLEGAAGVAGLIKLVLAMQNRELPPSLHVNKPNPFIPWDELPVKVTTQRTAWQPVQGTRMAGVSSFGFSGTNAHVVVEEAPPRQAANPVQSRPRHLLTLSGTTEEALLALTGKYQEYLESNPAVDIANFCFTANSGRAHWSHRMAIVGESASEISSTLGKVASGSPSPAGVIRAQKKAGEPPKLALLFTGQGSQFSGMGRRLYDTHPSFRRTIDRCNELLQDELNPSLLEVLYPQPGQESLLDETAYTQPALFSLEYALAQVWLSWGIRPAAVMGHSVGEYVAACIAGVFKLEEGLRLIAARGRLMQQMCERGAMAAVAAEEERVAGYLKQYRDRVSIAALNGPANTVISGRIQAVDELLARFAQDGIKTKRLIVSHGFHSPLMEPMLESFRRIAETVKFETPRIPLISNRSGLASTAEELCSANYWVEHVRRPVNFSASMKTLHGKGFQTFLEVGPAPTLLGMGARCLPEGPSTWLPSLRKDRDDWQQMLDSLAALYVHGAEVDWKGFDRDFKRQSLVLPTYPFQRTRFWIDLPKENSDKTEDSQRKSLTHPLLNHRIDSPFLKDILIESRISTAELPWLKDHQAFGATILPATAYLEMVLAAAHASFGPQSFSIRDMDIREAMVVQDAAPSRVHIAITPGDMSFQLASSSPGETASESKWKVHTSGRLRIEPFHEPEGHNISSLEEVKSRCSHEVSVETYRKQLDSLGMYVGPSFRGLQRLWTAENEVLGEVHVVPEIAAETSRYRIHPGLLDACLQPFAVSAMSSDQLAAGDAIYMPVGVDTFTVYREPPAKLWSHIVVSRGSGSAQSGTLHVDTVVFDDTGAVVAEVRGLSLRRADRQILSRGRQEPLSDWLYELTWKEFPLTTEAEGEAAPVPFASTLQIADELRTYATSHSKDEALAEFEALFPKLEALSTRYIYRALDQLGWKIEKHESFSTDTKAAKLRIPAKYRRLFERMLEILETEDVLRHVDGRWEVRQLPPAEDNNISADSLLQRYPACSAELNMTARCGEHIAAVIRGECNPLDVLFPGGSVEDIEKLYRDSPFSRFYQGLAHAAVRELLSRVPADRPLRILEIGGGTGSTTTSILPELAARRVDYRFTDASPLFLASARDKFGKYPFVKYQTLDIENDPSDQGFEAHSCDIVIAANVLHATQDLRQTLENVRELLTSDGVLLLLEGTKPLRFGDVIVGLTEGWWRFTDTELRPSHALISDRKWTELLADCGFHQTIFSPEADGVLANQSLIISRGPHLSGADQPHALPRQARGQWIVFAESGGLGESLCETLRAQGTNCLTVLAGENFEKLGERRFQIGNTRDDHQRLLRETVSANGPVAGIVYLWPLDIATDPIQTRDGLDARVQAGCQSLLHTVQVWISEGAISADSLYIVTRGAQSIDSSMDTIALALAPVSAIGSAIALEHPELKCCRIDLDRDPGCNETHDLLHTFRAQHEDLIAFRAGRRYAARLTRARLEASVHHDNAKNTSQAYQLETSSPGRLDRLALSPLGRRRPLADEVEVEVTATGLNFRDVLIALGRYPGDSQIFGYECAGKIVALGERVQDFKLGQRVIVLGPGSFSSHMTVPSSHLLPIATDLSDNEAAAIPSAFLTAYYALWHLGRITAGDRILIHAAAGGVGLAAVQIAQRAGAEIFATAGSPKKREYLKSLGVAHVMDSRSLDFASETMQATGGRGVDMVLNCLAGEAIEKSFSVVAENGRFLEIGMTGIWDQARVSQLGRNLSYYPINLAATFREEPDLVAVLLRDLMQEFATGSLKSLPLTVFPIKQISDAFRHMAQARHIGKIVVTHSSSQSSPSNAEKPELFSSNASYMITGGLAGLGLLAAEWLVRNGARHLVLMGRSEPSAQTLEVVRRMERAGARVLIARGDVADRSRLEEVFANFGGTLPPLAGILHSAGTLDDGFLLHQNWERFAKVLAPKVTGSWHLHELTRDLPLDFFVLFSSAVSMLGSAGQANHVAACAFEDALAHYRRAQGLPALSIDWGPWAEAGAATRGTVTQRVQFKGFQPILPEQGFRVLEHLIGSDRARVGVMSVDWRQYANALPAGHKAGLLSDLIRSTENAAPIVGRPSEKPHAVLERLQDAPAAKRLRLLSDFVRSQAVKVLGLDASRPIDDNQPLNDFGLDSLMAVELRSLLTAELGLARSLPATLVFDYPTIAALTTYLAEEVLMWEQTPASEPDSPQQDDLAALLSRVEGLSDEDVNRMYNPE